MEESEKQKALCVAIREARRFIKLAEAAKSDYDSGYGDYCGGTKKTGAVRRASLDLTRALSEYRRPVERTAALLGDSK